MCNFLSFCVSHPFSHLGCWSFFFLFIIVLYTLWRVHTHNVHNTLHSLYFILLTWTHCIGCWSMIVNVCWLFIFEAHVYEHESVVPYRIHKTHIHIHDAYYSPLWIKCTFLFLCSIEKFYNMLKNALISNAVFVSWFWCFASSYFCLYLILSALLLRHPTLFLSPSHSLSTFSYTFIYSILFSPLLFIYFSSSSFHSLSLSFSSFHSLTHSLCFLSGCLSHCCVNWFQLICWVSLFFSQPRNFIKPIAWKSFKSETVFKKHFADSFLFFCSFLLFFAIHQPKIHSNYFKIQ